MYIIITHKSAKPQVVKSRNQSRESMKVEICKGKLLMHTLGQKVLCIISLLLKTYTILFVLYSVVLDNLKDEFQSSPNNSFHFSGKAQAILLACLSIEVFVLKGEENSCKVCLFSSPWHEKGLFQQCLFLLIWSMNFPIYCPWSLSIRLQSSKSL